MTLAVGFMIGKFAQEFCVVRTEQGDYDIDGVYSPGKVHEYTCYGSIQPLNGAETQRLPNNFRASNSQKLYTQEALRTAEVPGQTADKVLFKGIAYEVSRNEDWDSDGSYHKYILQKVGQ